MDSKDNVSQNMEKEKENIIESLEDKIEKNNDNDIKLLNKKTKPESDILKTELNQNKNKQKKLENENTQKKIKEYEYNYIINFLESGEKGLMEDFLPKNLDSTDFYNYGLTPEQFEKRLHESLMYHYERHLKEEKEKRDKMNMFMLNINMNMNNMGNNFGPRGLATNTQMNNFMMNNNLNYSGIAGDNNMNKNNNENI